MKRIIYRLSSVFIVACFTLLFLTISCSQNKSEKQQKTDVKVGIIEVKKCQSNISKTYIARVRSSHNTIVSSPFPAKLESLNVSQGQRVEANQVLAKVKSESVESAYTISQASLQQAEDAYQRISKVKESGSISSLQIKEVETSLEKARAAMLVAEKSKSDCEIRAPFSGTISEIFVGEGENLIIAQSILSIVDLNKIEFTISVPETEIASIKKGASAQVLIPALDNAEFKLRVVRKGVVASSISHNYECVLEPLTNSKDLMPGMVGKLQFTQGDKEHIIIPASAIKTDKSGRYVWIVNDSLIVEKRYVQVQDYVQKGISITSGLNEGDKVIVEGSFKISTGMKVRL